MNNLTAKTLVCAIVLPAALACEHKDDSEALIAAIEKLESPGQPAATELDDGTINPRLLRRFEPLRAEFPSASHPSSPAMVELGRMLYFEKRLSRGQDLSCNSCHVLTKYGVDNQPRSPGHKGQLGARNSPTVYNAAGFLAQFWDGRAPDVETQAVGPLMNSAEMAAPSPAHVEKVLGSMPEYVVRFREAFPKATKPITLENVGIAIGAFERKLSTPSRWDAFLRGDTTAYSGEEIAGLKAFTSLGCMVCHTGEFLGGSMLQKVGAVVPWPNQADQGRYEVTKNEADRMVFRVPSLRNVAMTAPYFHDGSAKTLPDAVRMMAKHQLGLDPSEGEIASIVLWLSTLTGEIPQTLVAEPKLPESTATTPAPTVD